MKLRTVLASHARSYETGPARKPLDLFALRDDLDAVRARVQRDVGLRVATLGVLLVMATACAAWTGEVCIVAGVSVGATIIGFFVIWQITQLTWEKTTTDLLLTLTLSVEPDLVDTVVNVVARDLEPASPRPEESADIVVLAAQQDRSHLAELMKHLNVIERQGVRIMHRYALRAGASVAQELRSSLERARIAVLLVSPDMIAGNDELRALIARAVALRLEKKVEIVPVIVRHCLYAEEPYAGLLCLPRSGLPIAAWDNGDAAWLDVSQDLVSLWRTKGTGGP